MITTSKMGDGHYEVTLDPGTKLPALLMGRRLLVSEVKPHFSIMEQYRLDRLGQSAVVVIREAPHAKGNRRR
jgi:hypothetical protein